MHCVFIWIMTIKQGIFSLSLLEYLTDLKDSLSSLSLIFYMCLFPVIPDFLPWSHFTHPLLVSSWCLEGLFKLLTAQWGLSGHLDCVCLGKCQALMSILFNVMETENAQLLPWLINAYFCCLNVSIHSEF